MDNTAAEIVGQGNIVKVDCARKEYVAFHLMRLGKGYSRLTLTVHDTPEGLFVRAYRCQEGESLMGGERIHLFCPE